MSSTNTAAKIEKNIYYTGCKVLIKQAELAEMITVSIILGLNIMWIIFAPHGLFSGTTAGTTIRQLGVVILDQGYICIVVASYLTLSDNFSSGGRETTIVGTQERKCKVCMVQRNILFNSSFDSARLGVTTIGTYCNQLLFHSNLSEGEIMHNMNWLLFWQHDAPAFQFATKANTYFPSR